MGISDAQLSHLKERVTLGLPVLSCKFLEDIEIDQRLSTLSCPELVLS